MLAKSNVFVGIGFIGILVSGAIGYGAARTYLNRPAQWFASDEAKKIGRETDCCSSRAFCLRVDLPCLRRYGTITGQLEGLPMALIVSSHRTPAPSAIALAPRYQ